MYIEPLNPTTFKSRHDYEIHLLFKKVSELVEEFNKSCTPQTPPNQGHTRDCLWNHGLGDCSCGKE